MYNSLSWFRSVLIGLLLGSAFVSCGTPDAPCDSQCEGKYRHYFVNLFNCDELCDAPKNKSLKLLIPPQRVGERPQPASFDASQCGQCWRAWRGWLKGQDCERGKARCTISYEGGFPQMVLQRCVFVNDRYVWSKGRECDSEDEYPCVKLSDTFSVCIGCQSDDDCNRLKKVDPEQNKVITKFTCDTNKGQCYECTQDSDCKNSIRTCVDGLCNGCAQDSHCAPEVTGEICGSDSRCVCEDDETCKQAGFLSCNQETGKCVNCKTNQECQEKFDTQSFCGDTRRCISRCSSNDDCQHYASATCSPQQVCAIRTRSCQNNAQCEEVVKGSVCVEGQCTKPDKLTACTTDQQCQRFAANSVCKDGRCVRPGATGSSCKTNADCKEMGPGGTCDNGKCVRQDAPCLTTATCQKISTDLVCNQGRCTPLAPITCQSDKDCEKGTQQGKCTNGRCIAADGCSSDNDCQSLGSNFKCHNGRCVQGILCRSHADCEKLLGQGATCVLGRCKAAAAECTQHIDCRDINKRCVQGSCVTASTTECSDQKPCPSGQSCVLKRCVTAPTTECSAQKPCPSGQRCESGKCVASTTPECSAQTPCPSGKKCENGKCVDDTSSGCNANNPCPQGERCFNQKCLRICGANRPCPQGQRCVNNICQ